MASNSSFALGKVYADKLTALAATEGRSKTETMRRALDALEEKQLRAIRDRELNH